MLINQNQPNPFDPNTTITTISAPLEFTVRNLDRTIKILMGTWYSTEALMAGYAPISKAEYFISGSNYFDMVEANSGHFLGISSAIDQYLVQNGFPDATVVPATLPVRPSGE